MSGGERGGGEWEGGEQHPLFFPLSSIAHPHQRASCTNTRTHRLVAHGEEKIKSALPNRDIGVLERVEDRGLVTLDELGGGLNASEAGHRVKAEVANVWLANRDEAAKQPHRFVAHRVRHVAVVVDDEVNCLEEHRAAKIIIIILTELN